MTPNDASLASLHLFSDGWKTPAQSCWGHININNSYWAPTTASDTRNYGADNTSFVLLFGLNFATCNPTDNSFKGQNILFRNINDKK